MQTKRQGNNLSVWFMIIEENREIFERKIQRYEERLNKTYHEENRIYNKKLEELEKEKKNS